MTPIYICVHACGLFSWHDQDTGKSVTDAKKVPVEIWSRVSDDERHRVNRRCEKLKSTHYKYKTGKKTVEIIRMMKRNHAAMRAQK